MCFVYLQSSLQENVVFSVCARMGNAVYIIFITLNSISGLDTSHHFRLNINFFKVKEGGVDIFFGGEGQFSRLS